jgi:N6-adenosine-specific RNA methylase IME4
MRYRTIVADPPWPHDDKAMPRQRMTTGEFLPYATMPIDEIKSLPVKDWAEGDKWHVNGARGGCNLFLWTTTRFLETAYDVARAWRFNPTALLVWCKPHGDASMGGTFSANVEFVVVARRGSPPRATGSSPTRWFQWPRGRHSEKPDAFYDLVEQISVGPYLEMFARRARFGWDYWGDESLGTAQMAVKA